MESGTFIIHSSAKNLDSFLRYICTPIQVLLAPKLIIKKLFAAIHDLTTMPLKETIYRYLMQVKPPDSPNCIFYFSLTAFTSSADLWTPPSGCGTSKQVPASTRSWATSRSHPAWSCATTSSFPGTPTPPSKSGTSQPASVSKPCQVESLFPTWLLPIC